jgi:NAD(P)H-dependent FMN reductase
MPTPTHILGVSGSMRERSHSARALGLVLDACRAHGAETRLLDLRTLELPVFRPDRPCDAACAREAAEAVRWADAIVIATPDYHGSMSGAVKNFLDYHWKEFTGKLFGYVVASHEKGLTVMDQLRTAVRQCYGWSLPYGVSTHGAEDFDPANGALANPKLANRLRMLGRDVVVYGRLLREQFARDAAEKVADTFAAYAG